MTEEKTHAIIVDDEADARESLEILLQDIPKIEIIGQFESVDKAIDFISSHPTQLVFLDIDMPGKNGFVLIEELKDLHMHPAIIFITAHAQHAIEAIEEAAFGYLLKPIDPVKLRKVINRYICERSQAIKLPSYKKLKFNTRAGFILINPLEIVYCQAEGNYTKIVLTNEKSHIIPQQIGSIESILKSEFLYRVGRSYIINLNCLISVDRKKRICILDVKGKEMVIKIPKSNLIELERNL
ncbi:MAG: LytTR family DNA-binding domain-containing protein [Bacteroidales bacterium]|nr:LytTR family DNA-binding domain-containing protein [Bacteroidales bacterium]MCF8456178.1 LytTR family DNA-binding domain-containing protein [Bacteroidales bacterium]